MTIGYMKCCGDVTPIEMDELSDEITFEDPFSALTFEFSGIDPESVTHAPESVADLVGSDEIDDDCGIIALDGGDLLKVAVDADVAVVLDSVRAPIGTLECFCSEQ